MVVLSTISENFAPARARTISTQDIFRRFCAALHQPLTVDLRAGLDSLIRPVTPAAIRALADRLNTSASFSTDGLALVPGDLARIRIIGDICVAIANWYHRNGWIIT